MSVKISRVFTTYQLPAILWAILIFIASSLPDVPTPELGLKFEDKWHHLIIYGILGLLVARAFYFQAHFPRLKMNCMILTIFAGGFYGITDEIHQAFVPGRFSDFWDFVADFLGVLIGVGIFRLWQKYYRRQPLEKF